MYVAGDNTQTLLWKTWHSVFSIQLLTIFSERDLKCTVYCDGSGSNKTSDVVHCVESYMPMRSLFCGLELKTALTRRCLAM